MDSIMLFRACSSRDRRRHGFLQAKANSSCWWIDSDFPNKHRRCPNFFAMTFHKSRKLLRNPYYYVFASNSEDRMREETCA